MLTLHRKCTALPERRREHLFNRTFQAFMAVRREVLNPVQAALLQAHQKRRPAGFAFLFASSTASTWR